MSTSDSSGRTAASSAGSDAGGEISAQVATEVLIVGGGLAGPAAAIRLARAGRRVILLEKEAQAQHKVCGEFLSQEALAYLAQLGIDAAALGAVPIKAVRLAGRGRAIAAPLPFAAMSITRKRLDEELLRNAEAAGAQVLRGRYANTLQAAGSRWRAGLRQDDRQWQNSGLNGASGEPMQSVLAEAAFLATGKHDMQGRARPPGRQRGLVAFKMYWRLEPEQAAALAGHVELVLFPGGYAGLQPVEGGMANLCCLMDRGHLQEIAKGQGSGTSGDARWQALLAHMQQACPHLRGRLAGAHPLLPRPLAAAGLPYGYVRAASDGVWALGDQAAVIPSFTGDGMSIALHSGCLAADLYLRKASPEQFQQRLHTELTRQVALATLLSRGLVRPSLQGLFASVVAVWPASLGVAARLTRLSADAMLAQAPGTPARRDSFA